MIDVIVFVVLGVAVVESIVLLERERARGWGRRSKNRVLFKRETTFGTQPAPGTDWKPLFVPGAASMAGTVKARLNCPGCGCGISLEIDVPPTNPNEEQAP